MTAALGDVEKEAISRTTSVTTTFRKTTKTVTTVTGETADADSRTVTVETTDAMPILYWAIGALAELFRGSFFYLAASAGLLWILRSSTGAVNTEMSRIIFENLAPASLIALFSLGLWLSAASVLACGRYDSTKWWNNKLYRYLVFPVLNTAKAITLTGTGMIAGLVLVGLFDPESAGYLFKIAMFLLIFIGIFFMLSFTEYVVTYGYGEKGTRHTARYLLWGTLVLIPATLLLFY